MTRLVVASCMAAVCSVGLTAQGQSGTTPQTPSTTSQQPAQKSASDDKSTVLQGCLRAGDQPGTFVLQNASATSGGTIKNATVELSGSPSGADLKDHVGHTVEVTGTLAGGDRASGASSSGATASASGAGSGAQAGTSGSAPGSTAAGARSGGAESGAGAATSGTRSGDRSKLTIKTIKHVKGSC